ncbi:MAG: flagellar hook protein FlgE [Legionellales bacterium]|nr:flagellar hook protein FlgE [Legionellales bacterium]
MSINTTAISGLRAATTQLEYTGNNIANASTYGFKQSYVDLADSFAQGRSGRQLVNGVQVQNIGTDFSQGGFSLTSRQLDLAITADESFLVMRSSVNGETSYTRAGRMQVNKDGLIVNANNERLQAFAIDTTTGVTSATLSDAIIPTTPLGATATTTASYEVNLDANTTPTAAADPFDPNDPTTFDFRNDTIVYDSLGISHTLETYYRKNTPATNNQWNVYALMDGIDSSITAGPPANLIGTVTFNNAGTYAATTIPATIGFTPTNGAAVMSIATSYQEATQFGSDNQTRRIVTNGFPAGEITSINIDDDGIVSARYSNGQLQNIAQLALAEFPAVSGLQKSGNMSYKETNASGPPVVQVSNSIGAFQSGSLEESNVDLTQELVSLVTTQRYFQSNARVVTTADEITQTILQI